MALANRSVRVFVRVPLCAGIETLEHGLDIALVELAVVGGIEQAVGLVHGVQHGGHADDAAHPGELGGGQVAAQPVAEEAANQLGVLHVFGPGHILAARIGAGVQGDGLLGDGRGLLGLAMGIG